MASRGRPRTSSSSLVWGLLFLACAALGLWMGLGHTVGWHTVRFAIPCFLMGLGVLGLLVDRHQRRRR